MNVNEPTIRQLSPHQWIPLVMINLAHNNIEEAALQIYAYENHILTIEQCLEIINYYNQVKDWKFIINPTPEILIIENYRMN